MSSRAMRKLQNRNELEDLAANILSAKEVRKSVSEDEDLAENYDGDKIVGAENDVCSNNTSKNKNKKKKARQIGPENPFAILNNGNDIEKDEESHQSQDEETDKALASEVAKTSKKKKKKAKKTKNKLNGVNKETNKADADELEEIGQTVSSDLLNSNHQPETTKVSINEITKPILSVEHRWLDAANEVRKIFGSSVVQQDRRAQGARGQRRATWLVTPKANWPQTKKAGLSMDLVENNNGVLYFTFSHNKSYQQIQFQFLDGVESHNPQKLINLLNEYPYHVDTLMQVSEVFKMNEDLQTASQMIERALYVFETSFHPSFSLTQGTCRLDFRYPENRSFYLALFHHLTFVGRRGCYRTALEVCKLILSLDPDNDPLCVLLMIDFYALRSSQYSYLIHLCRVWDQEKCLQQLPNFAFSLPLAMYHSASAAGTSVEEADRLLQEALLMFPSVLNALLDKCSIAPDQRVTKSAFFNYEAQKTCSDGLTRLVQLYVGRCFSCWKEAAVVPWLERNVTTALDRVDRADPLIEEFANKRASRYKGMPRNIYRHIVMSDIKEAAANLPYEVTNTPVLSYDPLPPLDSIVRYQRPQRPRRAQESSNPLSAFLRSLSPNYNPNDEVVEDEGAVGGRMREGTAEWQSVNGLMDAMRALLQNINFIGDQPGNNEPNQPNEDEDDDEIDPFHEVD